VKGPFSQAEMPKNWDLPWGVRWARRQKVRNQRSEHQPDIPPNGSPPPQQPPPPPPPRPWLPGLEMAAKSIQRFFDNNDGTTPFRWPIRRIRGFPGCLGVENIRHRQYCIKGRAHGSFEGCLLEELFLMTCKRKKSGLENLSGWSSRADPDKKPKPIGALRSTSTVNSTKAYTNASECSWPGGRPSVSARIKQWHPRYSTIVRALGTGQHRLSINGLLDQVGRVSLTRYLCHGSAPASIFAGRCGSTALFTASSC